MVCGRGKAHPDRHTTLRLFADSGGYCQNPACHRPLFVNTATKNIHIAEMAHVFAANNDGPRANPELSPEVRGAYDNLILLCSACHTEIDKAAEDYPDELLREWKASHSRKLAEVFGAFEYTTRAEVRQAIRLPLDENRFIFETYGPDNDYRFNPEAEEADVWKRKLLDRILPNNRKILAILDANRGHLVAFETNILEEFRSHVCDLEARHLGEGSATIGQRFPEGMHNILGEEIA